MKMREKEKKKDELNRWGKTATFSREDIVSVSAVLQKSYYIYLCFVIDVICNVITWSIL